MDPCHTKPFIRPGKLISPTSASSTDAAANGAAAAQHTGAELTCDYCGAVQLEWRKCKLICTNCHQINKSCADL